jgi:hypothetical protein
MRNKLTALRDRHAKLPWKELEAKAARQGCSPADIFFDRAGRMTGFPVDPHCGPRAVPGPVGIDFEAQRR